MWKETRITRLLNLDYPIMQGPFGGNFSTAELVAAVSNSGGLGGYGAYTLNAEEIAAVIKQINSLTNKPYNMNLWVSDSDAGDASITEQQYDKVVTLFKPYFDKAGIEVPANPGSFKSRFENQVQVILDHRPKVFSFVFGIPSQTILEDCRRLGVRTAGAATTLDEAMALENAGVDMIIASGFEAGGHRPSFLSSAEHSTTGSFVLLQLIREKTKLPVIAAGGIANGRGVAAALILGADAVQIGTAFLATEESGALPVHRDMLFSDAAKYTSLTRAFTGRLGRGISNQVIRETQGQEKNFLPFPLQTTFLSALRKAALEKQLYELIFFWSGQIAPILRHTKAEELMRSLIEETSRILGEN